VNCLVPLWSPPPPRRLDVDPSGPPHPGGPLVAPQALTYVAFPQIEALVQLSNIKKLIVSIYFILIDAL
jgi:hypothetical protein